MRLGLRVPNVFRFRFEGPGCCDFGIYGLLRFMLFVEGGGGVEGRAKPGGAWLRVFNIPQP